MGRISLASEKLGLVGVNRYGSKYKIIKYNNYSDVWVEFENGEKTHTSYHNFKEGSIRNHSDISVFGVGFLGKGVYRSKINDEISPQYETWRGMIRRCYSENDRLRFPTYSDVLVDPLWFNFQIFAKWYDENYYEVNNEKMTLDKDIIKKGNKLYCPEMCIFVPQRINKLFIKCNGKRGKFPIGVIWHKDYKKYSAVCDSKHISWHDNPTEAFKSYKKYKESHIGQVAEEYKNKIPIKIYESLLNYKVEITD